MTGTNSNRHSSTRSSNRRSSVRSSARSGDDDDDMKIRNSDLSSVGHKVRMLTLLQQEADKDEETHHSHTESSNDTRSTNATAADDTFQKHDSLCLHPPLEQSVLDPASDGLVLRTTSSTTSSSSSSNRPMSFVSSISSASASGVTQITPEDYPDHQVSAKHKPDKEPLWREERYLATAVSDDNDNNPTTDDTDAWKLVHDMLRGEAKDLVSCVQALLQQQQVPPAATKQLNGSTKQEEPNDSHNNTQSISTSVPAPAVELNDSQDAKDNTPPVSASATAPTPAAAPTPPLQQWQVEALQSILEAHTDNLRHYHQLYHGVLLPALVQRFRVPKANEHDIEHRELLRRLKSARAEILDPLLEAVVNQDSNETEVNKSASGKNASGKSETKNRFASSNPAASCVAGASTVSLLSRLLAQLQAYKARLERHLYGQEETTLILMQAFFTPRQMQRLRLTRIWLAPSFASHTLFWGSLVHRMGLARFRLRFLEQERVPKALWYWSFKPAWKAYVTEILKPTQALKAGVLRLPEGTKTSSKKSSSKTASTSSSLVLLSSTGTSVPAKDEATATDGVPVNNNNKSSGVLLRSWKHSSGSSSSSKRARVSRASVKVLRSWKRNSSKNAAQVVQC